MILKSVCLYIIFKSIVYIILLLLICKNNKDVKWVVIYIDTDDIYVL